MLSANLDIGDESLTAPLQAKITPAMAPKKGTAGSAGSGFSSGTASPVPGGASLRQPKSGKQKSSLTPASLSSPAAKAIPENSSGAGVVGASPAAIRPNSRRSSTASYAVADAVEKVWHNYQATTTSRTHQLDCFMLFLVVVGAIQFVYCLVVGNYPFNAFLSGFSATVGQFVLTASLRMQTTAGNSEEFKDISNERAFADYVFGSILLHLFCVNFLN